MFILKMENVGTEKKKVAFYNVQPTEDAKLLRHLVTNILDTDISLMILLIAMDSADM